jgi:adenosylcobinamide-phosphate synthase
MGIAGLAPSVIFLIAGVIIDAILGDPQVWFHPIRLMGKTLSVFEWVLRRLHLDGYFGGCLLFVLLAITWVAIPCILLIGIFQWSRQAGSAAHILLIYIFFALRDLIDHVRSVQRAADHGDVAESRKAIGRLVGRDIEKMDIPACRRAAIESISENLVDGVVSAVFWYALLGIPGLLLFKVVSTMDSMVGYKTPRYLRFGWCGARLDDLLNYIPARLTWLLLGFFAIPKGWRVGIEQHGILPGPNPGWSEATMAGVLGKKLIGPIWKNGQLVADVWLGDPGDPEAGSSADVSDSIQIVLIASVVTVLLGTVVIFGVWR